MNSAVAPATADSGSIIESVIVKGDLSKLTPQERTKYYVEVCKSVGLNPLTKPFEYITLNGKLTLYALRTCTDQLRTIHGVSVEELTESERDGVFIVTCKVRNKDDRTDMAKGAVTIASLKGDALANAMMKCETKAKRRATLSICGLGFLDETEIETIPVSAKGPLPAPLRALSQSASTPAHDTETGEVLAGGPPRQLVTDLGKVDWLGFGRALIECLKAAESLQDIEAWARLNAQAIETMASAAPRAHRSVLGALEQRRADLTPDIPDDDEMLGVDEAEQALAP